MVKKLLLAALCVSSLFGVEIITEDAKNTRLSTQQEQVQNEKPLTKQALLDEKIISYIGDESY